MADLAKLVVALEAQSAQFTKEIEKVNSRLGRFEKNVNSTVSRIKNSFARGFKGLAGFAIAGLGVRAVIGELDKLVDSADRLQEFSQQVGISVESLSTLEGAARQFGVEAGNFESSIIKLNRKIGEAAGGNKAAVESFQKLGVSVRETDGTIKTSEQVLGELADRFKALPDGPLKTAAAMDIFGKSGAQLIPFLNEGSEGIEKLKKAMEELGGQVSTEFAKSADEFKDNAASLGTALAGVGREILERALPPLSGLITKLKGATVAFRDFLDVTKQERIGDLSKGIKELEARLPNVAAGPDQERIAAGLAAYRKELALLKSDGGLLKGTLGGLTADLDAFGTAAQANAVKAVESQEKIRTESEKAASAHARAVESARDSLESLAQSAQQQAETFGLSESAVAKYRVTVGDLADDVRLAGEAGLASADAYVQFTAQIEEAQRQQEELNAEQAEWRRQSEEIASLQEELRPLISGVDQATQDYADTLAKFDRALAENAITTTEYAAGVENVTRKYEESQQKAEESFSAATEFGKEAARGIQDAFADFLFDPFDKGLKGMLDGFIKTMDRIAREISAAQISGALFGDKADQGDFSGGLFGKLGSFVGSLFKSGPQSGGALGADYAATFGLASGGPAYAGNAYVVGEEGPELFVPKSSGTVIPNGEAGGFTQNLTLNINAPNGVSRNSIYQIEAAAGLAVRRALNRRGA